MWEGVASSAPWVAPRRVRVRLGTVIDSWDPKGGDGAPSEDHPSHEASVSEASKAIR
jgi:hypothetical protein